MNHKEYLESDVWKCFASPGGAHHWHHVEERVWFCIYCLDVKEFPRSFSQAFEISLISVEKVRTNIQGKHRSWR